MIEARQMAGAGPWLTLASRGSQSGPNRFQEAGDASAAWAEIELTLQNVEWRREVNQSWLEFSRWGIQQIILISRLYYIKNPLIQRGINVAANYVFGRGVEISSPDEATNEILKEFLERNRETLGQIALVDLERRKYYDGNLFFCLFADTLSSGDVTVRTIDATEVMDIVTDPGDTDKPWFYRRCWTERSFEPASGMISTQSREAWYPALGYEPAARVPQIAGLEVRWDNPVLHRKVGAVSKWHFGCPLVYSALDWAKAARKFLEACATVKASLAQIAMTLTTKGGQQALQGMKQQLQTTVASSPGSNIWDTNPPATNAAIFGSGPDTVLAAFNTKGAGGDPKEVSEYRNMVACSLGIPPTFLGDLETANLATAYTLDRPTELNFLEKQEAWREDLMTICKYVLNVSKGAPAGKLREAHGGKVVIVEARRERSADGKRLIEAIQKPKSGEIIVSVNFPQILEGDLAMLITATCAAIQAGIDPKAGVKQLYDLLPGIEDGEELAEAQYPEATYDPDRTKGPTAAAANSLQLPNVTVKMGGEPVKAANPIMKESEVLSRRLARRLIESLEAERNGAAANVSTR